MTEGTEAQTGPETWHNYTEREGGGIRTPIL